jgi:hypothetical protein
MDDQGDRSPGDADREAGPTAGSREGAPEADLAALREDVEELQRTLADLQTELSPVGRGLFPTPRLRDLRRFTTEVTIPMAILVLETNVRALSVLQRALRLAEDREPSSGGDLAAGVGRRAADASQRTLGRLEGVLADLQASVAADEGEEPLARLLDDAATLQDRVTAELDRMDSSTDRDGSVRETEPGADPVAIDVEAELESIRKQIDEEGGGDHG